MWSQNRDVFGPGDLCSRAATDTDTRAINGIAAETFCGHARRSSNEVRDDRHDIKDAPGANQRTAHVTLGVYVGHFLLNQLLMSAVQIDPRAPDARKETRGADVLTEPKRRQSAAPECNATRRRDDYTKPDRQLITNSSISFSSPSRRNPPNHYP
jgi:hypothetical protein